MRPVTIGLCGLGTVGRGVLQTLRRNQALIRGENSVPFQLIWAGVRRPGLRRPGLPAGLERGRPLDLLRRRAPDVLVEVMGGLEAEPVICEALNRGSDVVTANKLLLASRGPRLFDLARARGRELRFEASVAGGLPVIQALRESLRADRVRGFSGILNGTTNYILSRLEEGLSFTEALAEARAKGFAEADASSDLSGKDALYKTAILAGLAFGGWIRPQALSCRGIEGLEPSDLEAAAALGFSIRLLGWGRLDDQGRVEARVEPCLLPKGQVLASVRGTLNAVSILSEPLGRLDIFAQGAGAGPTASAVVADLAAILARRARGGPAPRPPSGRPLRASPRDPEPSPYFLRLRVKDKPGVLSAVSGALGRRGISIATARQEGQGRILPLILLTHACAEKDLQKALGDISRLSASAGAAFYCRLNSEVQA